MKHILVILFLLLSVNIKAQSFTVIADTTVANDSLNSEMIFNLTVTNNSNGDLTFYVKRTVNNLPADWTSSLCFSFCFSPTLDSIATTSDFGARALSPGESRELSLHVFPHTNYGSGIVTLRFGDAFNFADSSVISFTANANPTGVEENRGAPSGFKLFQNYPNPLSLKGNGRGSAVTTIRYKIASVGKNSVQENVKLTLYNILGEKVKTLVDKTMQPGVHEVKLQASDLPAGIYFYRLTAGRFSAAKKMILIR